MWRCNQCQTNSEGQNFCTNCGAPRHEESESVVQTTRNNNGVVITLVICVVILAILLVGVVAVGIASRFAEENDTSFMSPPQEEVIEETLDEFDDFSEEVPVATPVPTPVPTETPAAYSETNFQKDAFLERARQIETYEENVMKQSMPQQDINYETGIVFSKWDALLNDIYQHLKKTLPSSQFETLRKEEVKWIKEKEAACERAEKEWEGGSGAPMAWNMTASEYTKARVYELINMIG